MARSKNGEAVPPARRTAEAVAALRAFAETARSAGRVDEWARAHAILSYIDGQRVVDIARTLAKGRSTVNDWLRWYAREGSEGLRSAPRGRSIARLGPAQRDELAAIVDKGPLAAGLPTAMWTGKSLAVVIERTFGVSFHPQSVPRLLHEMGFSLQRPRKRLARADAEAQATWARDRLPALKKKRRHAAE